MNKTENDACEATGKTLTESARDHSNDTTPIRGIYGLRNKVTGKWYVGQSWDILGRWKAYKRKSCRGQTKLFRSLTLRGWDGFDAIILEEIKCPSQLTLDRREDHWIETLNSIENGYNLRRGGSRGKLSEETKKKLSERNLGRKLSADHVEKIRVGNVGKVVSESTRKKLGDTSRGRPHTEEQNHKQRVKALERIVQSYGGDELWTVRYMIHQMYRYNRELEYQRIRRKHRAGT